MSIVDVQLHWGIKIPLRNGLHLNALLYLPRIAPMPAPAIFVLTPYVAQVHHDQGVYFANAGYCFLSVDVRGRGDSQGEFHPSNDANDGYDIVEWLAQQPYCNGKVAMWGGSYMGYTQWATAKTSPPHLAALAPTSSPYRGVDSPLRNNQFKPYTMKWLTLLSGRASQERVFADRGWWNQKFREWFEQGRPFKELDAFLGNVSPLFQEWISHPQPDAYWDGHNPDAREYARLSIPVLTIVGTYDGNQPGALAHYREHLRHCSAEARAWHYLIIGPWDHAGTRIPKREFAGVQVGPASLLDMSKFHLEWYDWTLRGGDKPSFLKKNVAYYVMGTERWRYADTLEAITHSVAPLYLSSNGNPTDIFHSGYLLPRLVSESEPDSYVHDPRVVGLAQLESELDAEDRTDQRMIYAAAGRQLIYHSEPYSEPIEVSGFFELTVWLSIDQPDTDFAVSVHEVRIDGSSVQLATDSLRARYRENPRREQLIDTTAPLRYEFRNFTFVSRLIGRGSRLRLVIGPMHSIHAQKNYQAGGVVAEESVADARVVKVKLFHSAAHPSALFVPVGHAETPEIV